MATGRRHRDKSMRSSDDRARELSRARSPWRDKSRTGRLAAALAARHRTRSCRSTCSKAGLPVSRVAIEIGPGPPILLDHDLDFLGEPRGEPDLAIGRPRSARTRRPAAPRKCRCCTSPRKKRWRCGADRPSVRGQLLGRRGPRREPVGQAELDRGIDQRRLVIGLDLPAQPVLEGVDLLIGSTVLS